MSNEQSESKAASDAAAKVTSQADVEAEARAVAEANAKKEIASDDGKEEIFSFPCDFPLKVMGVTSPEFAETVLSLVEKFDPTLDRSRVETRPSSSGKYTGLTLIINAQSRKQLDDIYRAVTAHPLIKYVL